MRISIDALIDVVPDRHPYADLAAQALVPCNPMDGLSSIKAFIAWCSASIFMISQPDGV